MTAFRSQYRGKCHRCQDYYEPGDMLVRDEEDGRPAHEECEAMPDVRALQLRADETVCTTCFLVRPCECDKDGKEAA